MKKIYKIIIFILLFCGALLGLFLLTRHGNFAVLNPKGVIATKERGVMVTATLLMLIVVIPVFITLFFFAWKYRATNTKAQYDPTWDKNSKLEFLWWAIPGIIILIISVINWKSSHELDPYKPINSDIKPITIQVVALPWKWLFIYPEQNIATINFIEFPVNTPLNFELTADAPMNSFWIPQLGGQMYAMTGMKTHLHLQANETGEFSGSSAEISGAGFAGMKFIAKSTSQAEFNAWAKSIKALPNELTLTTYKQLALPSENNIRAFYSPVEKDLQNSIIMKFMAPVTVTNSSSPMTMPGMDSEAHNY